METLLGALLLIVLAVFAVAISRANELFCLSVRDGRVLYVRGRISPALLSEIRDVVERAEVTRASVRAVFSQGRVRLLVEGGDELVAQRLRNVVFVTPEHKLRAAKAPSARNLGQRLGFAWLAWYLHERDQD